MSRLKTAGKWTAAGVLAISLIGGYEGLRTKAYRDSIGIPTVCFGETRGVKMGDTYSVAECKEMFGKALMEFESRAFSCVKNADKIPDKPYVIFLSLSYNIGTGGFCKSGLVRKLNAGDLRGACNDLVKYNRAGGKVNKGLVNRRASERKICLEGVR